VEAKDGLAGTGVAKAEKPDLVIVDILMPEMDGLEVIREVKRDSPQSKIIAVSGGGCSGVVCSVFCSCCGTGLVGRPASPMTTARTKTKAAASLFMGRS